MVEGSPSGVSELIALGDAVYFLGQDGPSWQLYRADRSGNLEPLTEYPDLRRVLPFGRELALVVREAGPSGYSILIGDGTPAGSRTVAEGLGEPGLWSSSGGRFYVSTDQTRLWVGDGSPGGTLQVRDFALIDQGRSVDGRLAVSADDGPHGLEPWTSDGAAASTAQVGDICGGSCSSGPTIFAPVGQQILVSADDGTGAEPWAIPTPAVAGELVLPADGSLVRSTTHFEWTAGGQALEYWLQLGTTPGGHDLRDVSDGTHLAASVSGLPFDGSTIHARLWTRLPAPTGWVYRDATYQALSGAAAKLVEPASGPVGGPITLRWTSGENALEYWPQAGWSTGGTDLLDASNGMRRHVSLTVPSEGRTLHVRLWTRLPAPRGWVYTDSSFATEDLGEPAEVTAPAPGTALPSFQATFQWSTGGNAREYWLQAGRTQGSHSLHDASTGLLRSVSLANLPLDGGAVWVRLWTRLPAPRGWEYRDASYTAAGVGGVAAQLTAPAPWTLYTGPTLGLAWTSATGAQEYWLRVFAGGELVHDASAGLALARSLSLQPLPGGVSVQLWTRFPGAGWVMLDSYFPTP
jgi:ELWxxDGT repeat protein